MSAVVTVDPATGERLAEYPALLRRRRRCGTGPRGRRAGRLGAVFVDAVVATDVRSPFGGTRASGYGREPAASGVREFVDVRTWWVMEQPAATGPAPE
ncbi:hypothetical protein [Blastococcus capsensis]|uniref:hypothetical protein n=1 Tax=Blastococcus capsensis TaxID=1564163 RepID=UPI00254081D7|nr:hypothetical protein [Blastococcus capsensis]MDK3256517.1 hypothetical protein [Blastococcus capsensis]